MRFNFPVTSSIVIGNENKGTHRKTWHDASPTCASLQFYGFPIQIVGMFGHQGIARSLCCSPTTMFVSIATSYRHLAPKMNSLVEHLRHLRPKQFSIVDSKLILHVLFTRFSSLIVDESNKLHDKTSKHRLPRLHFLVVHRNGYWNNENSMILWD